VDQGGKRGPGLQQLQAIRKADLHLAFGRHFIRIGFLKQRPKEER
jgi:hypothetical protein